jgi:hypothetical protein
MLSPTLIRHGSEPLPYLIVIRDGRRPQPAAFSNADSHLSLCGGNVASGIPDRHQFCDNSNQNLSFTKRTLIDLVYDIAALVVASCEVTKNKQDAPKNIATIGTTATVSEKYSVLNDDAIATPAHYVYGIDASSDNELIEGLSRLDRMSETHSVVCAKRELRVELLARGVGS